MKIKFDLKNRKKLEFNIKTHDQLAQYYNNRHPEIYNPLEQSRLARIIDKLIGNFKNKKINVLDFGAGTGNLTRHFLNQGCYVTAADVSRKSLDILKKKYENSLLLDTKLLRGTSLPFKDNFFDICTTYSVLHHIQDYFQAIRELIRVTKPGGYIYIDHEHNSNHWNPNKILNEYYELTKKSKSKKFIEMLIKLEIFKPRFIKSFIIKRTINPRYKSEGDIHVWPDDHIQWDKIITLFKKNRINILKKVDYLMYLPTISVNIYNKYKNECNNMKYIIAKKTF